MKKKFEVIQSDTLQCGCIRGIALIDGVETLYVRPHKLSCRYYKYIVKDAKAQGLPIESKIAP